MALTFDLSLLPSVFDLYSGVGLQLPRIFHLRGQRPCGGGGGQKSLIADITFTFQNSNYQCIVYKYSINCVFLLMLVCMF